MTRLLVLLMVSITVLISCHKERQWFEITQTTEDMLRTFPNETQVETNIVFNDSLKLLKPFSLELVGDILLIKDYRLKNKRLLQVLDLNTNEIIGTYLDRGRGPLEYRDVNLSSFHDTLVVLATNTNTVHLFSSNKIRALDPVPDRTIKLETMNRGDVVSTCFFMNGCFVTSGFFQTGRFQVFDIQGNFVSSFGTYPNVNFNGDFDNLHSAYVYSLSTSLGCIKNHIYALDDMSLSLYEYDRNNNKYDSLFTVQWNIPDVFEASYIDGKPYVSQLAKGNMIGAGQIAVYGHCALMPFSEWDYNFTLFEKRVTENYNYVLVLKDGKPFYKFNLDKSIRDCIKVDERNKCVYGICTNQQSGLPEIISINLSKYEF